MDSHGIAKALEIWTLQNLFDFSIMLGLLALGIAVAQAYHRRVEQRLRLRLSLELWRVSTMLVVDILLVLTVLIGYMVMNPDIMADIKIAVPFCPAATVLFAAALLLRLFHNGHDVGTANYRRAIYCMLAANLLNIVGFTLVMEAPGSEYLEIHPSPFWTYVKAHFRSNAIPHGLELAQVTFYVCFALLMVLFVYAMWAALKQLGTPNEIDDENRS